MSRCPGAVAAGPSAPPSGRSSPRTRALRLSGPDWVISGLALGIMVVVGPLHEQGLGVRPGAVAAVALTWAPLLARGRWPLAALVVTALLEAAHVATAPLEAVLPFTAVPVATTVAAYSLAARRPRRTAWVAGGAASAVLLAAVLAMKGPGELGAGAFMTDLVLAATAAGVGVRARHRRLTALEARAVEAERTRHEEAARQVAAERVRIARDLHDVLAHHLTLVNAQAGVAEYLLRTDPGAAATALTGISDHTRRALDELRATVGLLRQDDDPEPASGPDARHPVPGLAVLDDLVAGFRSTGSTITVRASGRALPLAPSADVAAHRIIQEALTNAHKHAPGAPVLVELAWSPDALEVTVVNAPLSAARAGHRGEGTGHGLLGMRERALAAGGTLTAGRGADGSFAVRARVPAPLPRPGSTDRIDEGESR